MATDSQHPTVESRAAQPYVAIPAHVGNEAEFRRAADHGFPNIFSWLHERSVVPAGPPLIRYRAFSPTGDPAHVEIAVPVGDVLEGSEGIEAAVLPAGEWVTFLHRGPYTHASEPDLAAAHATVRTWIDEHDLVLALVDAPGNVTAPSGCIEQYRIGPVEQSDYMRWETELAYLIERNPS